MKTTRPKAKAPAPAPTTLIQKLEKLLFSSSEKQAFLEDLSTLVDDGVPANKAVEVIYKLSKGPTKQLAQSIMLKIAQGKAIADGMVGWMPQAMVELVRIGETSGTLAQNMRSAAESLGRKNDTVGAMISSLSYPLVVLLLGLFVLVYINNSVFSQFMSIKPLQSWPEDGKNLVALANFIQYWWWLCLLAFAGTVFLINRILSNVVGDIRTDVIDKIPLLKIYKQTTAARFMETLGMLITNGVVFKQSLKIMQQQANPYLGWHLMMMERRLASGRANIAEVLDTGLVNKDDILRLMAIADAKGFEHALVRLGKYAAMASAQTLRKLGKILGGILLALGAMLAGYMVMGIYSVGSSLAT
jgi:type II secretory pathway component PulF